jgi:hypothetical protein
MKRCFALASLLLGLLFLGGCVSGATSGGSASGARCLGRPDNSGTQPMIYLLCIQSS